MALKTQPTFEEQMIFIYYLQLQDRIDEAITLFKTLKIENLENSLKIQYDYLSAYFDIFTGAADGFKVARTVLREYDNYPVHNWKMMFLAIEDLLNDLDGEFDDMQQDDGSEKSSEDDISSKLSSDASMKQRKRDQMKKSKKKEPQLNPSTLD